MSAAPTTYEWVAQTDLKVVQGRYYRFVVLAPAAMTQDLVYSILCGSGNPATCTRWDIKSIGAPPADVLAALKGVLAVFPSATPPQAWYVIATWLPADATLPKPDNGLYYEQLAYYAVGPAQEPVPAPQYGDTTEQPAAAPSPWLPLLGGAAIAAGLFFIFNKSHDIPYARHVGMRANPLTPLQAVRVPVNGRPTEFVVLNDGDRWEARADLKIGRKKTRVTGAGSTKSEALQQAIQLASSAYASHDVRV